MNELSGKPKGYHTVWSIIRAFDDGRPIPTKELEALVAALRVFTADCDTDKALQDFGSLLKLRGKRGRHPATVKEATRRIDVAQFVLLRERELIAAGTAPKAARTAASREAQDRFHRSDRSVNRDLKEFGDLASC